MLQTFYALDISKKILVNILEGVYKVEIDEFGFLGKIF